jgi:transcriptional regulator with PAS, ATPase and Fis domain
MITAWHLPETLRPPRTRPLDDQPWWTGTLNLVEIQRRAIRHALAEAHGNRMAAARLLRISIRSLYRKLDRHGMRDELPESHGQDGD